MRLGIDYRLLASRENLVNRGIGRYTQQQLHHVLRLDTDNEYLLLCPPGSDTSLVLPEIRDAANVSLRVGPPASIPPPADPYDRRGLLGRAAVYQDWLAGLDLDVYHSTAPFVLEQTAPPAFDACPTVATVYDLIPLIFPSEYLRDPGRRVAYAGAARMVRTATRLIAISDGTRDDAANYLGFPRDSIDCARPFADACFRPMDDTSVAATLRPLSDRVGLPERFVLTVAALHHTKNLELLFAAYARLSAAFRRSLPLVVACHLDDGGAAHVRRWAGTFGVADDVVLTRFVPDEELAALYNRAELVVHPSRYEGFGLPVVEAMRCGAAVITTTAPSLPEVTSGAAMLVDPDDAAGLAAAIAGLAADRAERERMGEAGMARASAFTPEALARDTLASYRAAAGQPAGAAAGGPRLAVRTGRGSATGLVEVVPERCDVELFTDDAGPVPEPVLDRFPVHHPTALARCHARRPFDVVVDSIDAAREWLDRDARPTRPATALAFNKLCEVDDFEDPMLLVVLADLGLGAPAGVVTGTGPWSMAMSVRALAHRGLLGGDARILSLGAQGAHAALHLTRRAREVTLAGPWLETPGSATARALLVDPGMVATIPFDRARLVVRHVDLRRLPFADHSFDAVVGSRAVDGLAPGDVAQAVSEALRVVRPGGLVAWSAGIRMHGPAGGPGVPLERAVADLLPPGVEPLDALRACVSDSTTAARRRFSNAFGPAVGNDGDAPLTISGGALLGCLHVAACTPEGQDSG